MQKASGWMSNPRERPLKSKDRITSDAAVDTTGSVRRTRDLVGLSVCRCPSTSGFERPSADVAFWQAHATSLALGVGTFASG
jgi:hypothetical protein